MSDTSRTAIGQLSDRRAISRTRPATTLNTSDRSIRVGKKRSRAGVGLILGQPPSLRKSQIGKISLDRESGPPRHFFLSFLRFSIVTNYCIYRLYLLMITKATANIVKRCDDVPQKLRFSPNAGSAIRPSSPILMRWPWVGRTLFSPSR